MNEQFHNSGVLLLLDTPKNLEFGIDNISWIVGQKFKGIKLIPYGIHIISYSLKDEQYMFKISRFIQFTTQFKIKVYRWSVEYQYFVKVDDAEGYKLSVTNYHFDSYLGPYPPQNINFWSNNTLYISREVLQKLDPIDKIHKFQEEYGCIPVLKKSPQKQQMPIDNNEQEDQEQQEIIQDKTRIGKFHDLIDTIYYSEISRTLSNEPNQITNVNLDQTAILQKILFKQWNNNWKYLLGEIQYSFISFLIGQQNNSFEQYKKLISLIIFSQQAHYIKTKQNKPELYKIVLQLIPIFYQHLNQYPIDFFNNILTNNNFIENCLIRYKQYLEQPLISKNIKNRISKLFIMIENKFHYIVKDNNNEIQPIIVQQNDIYF